ncbi:MAG: hypothetical protein WAT66_05430, partial [Actinomycetota bacterium]
HSRGRTIGVAAAIMLLGAGAVIGALLVRSSDGTEPAPLKAGWSRQSGPGFTLGLPPGWRSFPTTTDSKAFADLEKSDPARATILREAFGGNLSPYVKFLAFDVGTPVSENLVTNMQVLVLPAPNGLDGFVETDARELADAEGVASSVEKQRIELPAGEAGIVSARIRLAGSAPPAAVIHYALVVEDLAFVMQFTTLADDLAELAPEFQDVARSFRFA